MRVNSSSSIERIIMYTIDRPIGEWCEWWLVCKIPKEAEYLQTFSVGNLVQKSSHRGRTAELALEELEL